MKTNSTYSIVSDPRINQYIDSDLEIIKNETIRLIDNVESIILGGGFGRGEGSIIVSETKIQPINDYDIYVVTKNKIPLSTRITLREKLASRIKIRQIDVEFKTLNQLRYAKNTVANYDLKYASKIIYGSLNILKIIPEIKSSQILLKESLIPLQLYGISIIQSYPINQNVENEFWGKQQISKSILGWSMALLVCKGKYHYSYKERQHLFKDITLNQEMINLVDFATNFKLRPSLSTEVEWTDLWYRNLAVYLDVYKQVYSLYYNRNISDVLDLIKCIRQDPINILKKIYGLIRGEKRFLERENLVILEILLLEYINALFIDNSTVVNEVVNELKKILKTDRINIIEALQYCIRHDVNCSFWNKKGSKIFY